MRPRILAVALLLIPLATHAQEIESLAGVRLTFENAGARALAMGSTGKANPADIAGAKRSFALESRRRTIEGRYFSDASLNTTGIDSTTNGVSSASLIVPMPHTTWAFFYEEPMNVEHSTASAFNKSSQASVFFLCNARLSATPCGPAVYFPTPVTYPLDTSLRLQRYGVTTAWSRGPLAIGASVRYERFHQKSAFVFSNLVVAAPAGVDETTNDSDTTYSAGATWKLSKNARIGASYASGGAFAGTRTFAPDFVRPIEFRTPSTLRGNVAIDVLPQLTLAADVVRVAYSEMVHSRRDLFPQGAELGYEDATELHAGAEYRIGNVAMRTGWWRDPAHALTSLNGLDAPPPFTIAAGIINEAENHVTAGIGFGGKTRFDAAIDRGSRSTNVVMGVTTTF
ncbi:MAG TPA: hypothetical protein VMU84_17845 [Thermoanaerobaculia bacterium]|nr:hypothetical protein [Thermoanaerobaculia bacterium]